MRKAILLLPILTLCLGTWAQKPPAQPIKPAQSEGLTRQEIEAYRKSLNITAAQKQKLKQLEQKYAKLTRAILAKHQPEEDRLRKSKGGGSREERFAIESKRSAEMKPIIAAYQKEMMAVYTPEQRKKMAAFQARNKALLLKSLKKSQKSK
ncbi:MAG: Spy/CpxP family protein refolding chaperone [Armatimonas sp.]